MDLTPTKERAINEDHSGFNVVLKTADNNLEMIWLPKRPDGRHYFTAPSCGNSIYMESHEGKWCACCTEDAFFENCPESIKRCVPLCDNLILSAKGESSEFVIFAESMTRESNIYHNYLLPDNDEISIGRTEDNDICYPIGYISSHHAVLRRFGHQWRIEDRNSLNGVFVNNKMITQKFVNTGDMIYLFGFRMIMGPGFVSINDRQKSIRINSMKLRMISSSSDFITSLSKKKSAKEETLFNRAPRRRLPIQANEIEIDNPPVSLKSNGIPLLVRMGSGFLMGGSALAMGNWITMANSMLFPLLNNQFSEKERKEYEVKRTAYYTKYISDKRNEIYNERDKEERILNTNYPPMDSVLSYSKDGSRLWERKTTDDDFLTLRLGNGEKPLIAKYRCNPTKNPLDED